MASSVSTDKGCADSSCYSSSSSMIILNLSFLPVKMKACCLRWSDYCLDGRTYSQNNIK